MRKSGAVSIVALILSVVLANAAFARDRSDEESSSTGPMFLAGGYLTGGFPIGDWGKIAGFGMGLDQTDILLPKPGKAFGIRSSLGVHYNFSRTVDVPPANLAPNSKLELETKNWSLLFGLGPEIGKQTGDVRPFAFGTIGFDTYWTKSTLSGTAGGVPYEAQHGDSKLGFAWSAGLGVRKRAAGVMTELSAEYRSGSGHEFLIPDEVTGSGTTVNAKRDTHTTDQIIVRLGTLFGGL